MTTAHRDIVLELAPRLLHKTFTLIEASRLAAEHNPRDVAELAALRPRLSSQEHRDIPDPIGQDSEFFAAIGRQIADALSPILQLCLRASGPTAD